MKKQDRLLREKLKEARKGRYVAEMKDSIERMEELFTEGLKEAGQNYRAAEQAVTDAAADAAEYDWSDWDDSMIEFSRRENEKNARMGGKRYSMRDLDIERTFIDYKDKAAESTAILRTAERLTEQGKLVEIDLENVNRRKTDTELQDRKTAKVYLKNILSRFIGESVYFESSDRYAEAYLTRAGIDHSAGGIITAERAEVFEQFKALVRKAEYSFSSENDEHSNSNRKIGGRIDWDCFVAVAKIGDRHYPVVFKIRTIDRDLRSQIHEMSMKKEADGSHDPGLQNEQGGMSAYGVVPTTSGVIVAQDENGVNAKFSLRQPVEETKTLIAMHNLTEEKLEKAIELGGFPMPSIAVTKANIPHTNFGEITLVMDKSAIDPEANRKNTVYSADAWTPTFPRTEYEADSEVEDRVRRTLQGLEKKIAPQFQGNLRRVMYGLEDLLNSYDGEENLIRHVMDNYGVKACYLESQGQHIDEVRVEREVPKKYNDAAIAKYEAIIDALGTRDPAEIGTMPLKDIRDGFGEALEKIVPGISKTSLRLSRFMSQTIDYLMDDGSGPTTETAVDYAATKQAVDDALDKQGFEAWVRELFSGIEGDKGIHNGKERFTPSGRSRSFRQTHLPVTLDNIVKAMAAQNGGSTKNVAGFNGVKTLRAGTAQRFKSIEGMHKLEGRLQNLTEEQQAALTDALNSRLYDLIDEIDRETGRRGSDNNLIRFDQIGQIITEASETGRYNVADIQRVFEENHHAISDELAMKVKELLFDVSQMPVNLFEAKPERAVRFDEVRAAVIPSNAGESLRAKLAESGVRVVEYEPQNTQDRLEKVNAVEGAKFSSRGSARDYSYEALVNKPDMLVAEVGNQAPIKQKDVIKQAKQNAASVGRYDPETGSVSVYVKDVGREVVLGTAGLKHGLDGRRVENAIVTLKAGEILQNSIRINELTPKKDEADSTYVLIGAAQSDNGDFYVVRSVVNVFSSELVSMDVLYAVNAKKGNRLRSMRPGFQGPVTDSTIRIAELLDYVNAYFPDILPEDVLKHYGHDSRPEGKLGPDALYSERDPATEELNRALEQENRAQKEELGYLRELVRLQGKITNGTKFTRGSVRELAKKLMKDAGAKGNYLELSEILNGVYEYIATLSDPAVSPEWEDIAQRTGEAAQWLMDHVEVKPDRGEYADEILKGLRTMRISLNEGQMAEAASRYGSYNDFRKAMFGSFVLSKDGTPLGVAWQDLAAQYPGTFDADVGDADMPLRLAEIVETLRDTDLAAQEFEMQRDGIRELVEKIREVYKGLKPDSREGRYVAEMKDSIERMEELFTEGLKEAGQNYRAAEQAVTDAAADAAEYDWSDWDDSMIEFSRRENEKTAREGGEVKYQARRLSEDDLEAYLRAGTRRNQNKFVAIERGEQIILTSEREISVSMSFGTPAPVCSLIWASPSRMCRNGWATRISR